MKKDWKIFLILIILIIIVYANSLNNVFLSDDIPGIVNNPHIGAFKWPGPAFLRSYTNDIFFNLWGLNPVPYRTLNILFHLGCTWLVFMLINFMTRKKSLAFWTAAIFAVHPVLTEPIIWISGGLYPQYSFFVLLGLWLYIIKDKNKKYYYFSLLSFLGALLSSEKAIIFPLIILLWEMCFDKFNPAAAGWKKITPYFVISAGWAIIYLSRIFQRFTDLQTWHYESPATYNPLLQIPIAISSYFELIFWPEKLTIYHTEMRFLVWEFVLRSVLVVLFIGLIIFLFVYKKSATGD